MALNFPADPNDGDIYEGYKYSLANDAWLPVSVIEPIGTTGKFNMDVYTNGQDILLDAERVLFGTVTGVTSSGSSTLYYTNGSTSPLAMAKFSVAEGSLYFRMDGGSAMGTAFETNLGLMGAGNNIIVDTEGGPYTVTLTSGFTYSEGGYYNATTSWPDGQGFTVWSGGSDTYTLVSTSYVVATDNSSLGTTHPTGTKFYIGKNVITTADASFSGSSVTLTSNPGVLAGDSIYDYSSGTVTGGLAGTEYDEYGVSVTPRIIADKDFGLFELKIPRFYFDTPSQKFVQGESTNATLKTHLGASGISYSSSGIKTYVGNVVAGNEAYNIVNGVYVDDRAPDFAQVNKLHKDSFSGPGIRSYTLSAFRDSAKQPGDGSINLSLSNSYYPIASSGSICLGGGSYFGTYSYSSTSINSSGYVQTPNTTLIGSSASAWAQRLPENSIVTGTSQSRKISWISYHYISLSGTNNSTLVTAFFPTRTNNSSYQNVCVIDSKFLYIDKGSGQIVSGTIKTITRSAPTISIVGSPVVTYDRKDIATFSITPQLITFNVYSNPTGTVNESAIDFVITGAIGSSGSPGVCTISNEAIEVINNTAYDFQATR